MPRSQHVPSYRFHKATGKAVVVIKGRSFYLGPWNSPESKAEYRRIIAEWLAQGPGAPAPPAQSGPEAKSDLRVSELILAYFRHVQDYYVKDGEPTSEVDTVRQALRPVQELYGHTLTKDFGPKALKACRDAMIAKRWARTYINRQVNRVRRMFAWGASNELLPAAIHQALATVPGLRKGRTAAKEKPPVALVPDEMIEKTLEHLRPWPRW